MSSASAPLQPNHLRNLILILRRANDHYALVAARIRATLRPSRHARRRAQHLGLTIDVAAAVKCPQKQVSNIPLPLIDVSPAPVPIAARPALKCVIPNTVLTRTSPNGTTSALSPGSVYSSITLSSAAPAQQPCATRYSSCWFSTEDEGYPCDATDVGALSVRAAPALQPVPPEPQWQPLDVPIDEDAMDWGLELQYPEDACDMDVSPSDSASSSGSNTDSSASSTGPATPSSNDIALPPMIRIKRKSVEVRDDELFEKRQRVFHNDDNAAQPQRRNIIRIPARR